MADKPKASAPASSPEDGHTESKKILFLFFAILILGGLLGNAGLNRFLSDTNSSGTNVINGDAPAKKFNLNNLGNLFPSGDISLGEWITTKKVLEVRNSPAGQVLGFQKRGVSGRVMEGPVSKFNVDWWRIDFKNAPDGWVLGNDITAYNKTFGFINFFPWLFSGLKQLLILLGFIAFVLLIIISFKISELRKLKKKKKELKKEQSGAMQKIQQNQNFPENPGLGVAENSADEFGEDVLPVPGLPIGVAPKVEDVSNRRWRNIQMLISSHNLNDWKQAIIESDIILDEMLEKMGYHGESIGERLKKIEPSDFLTLNQAWEAHKVRNKIAHKGSAYIISRDEAERVIKLYEEVFKEFYFI